MEKRVIMNTGKEINTEQLKKEITELNENLDQLLSELENELKKKDGK